VRLEMRAYFSIVVEFTDDFKCGLKSMLMSRRKFLFSDHARVMRTSP
jgi:hypothetical protein